MSDEPVYPQWLADAVAVLRRDKLTIGQMAERLQAGPYATAAADSSVAARIVAHHLRRKSAITDPSR